MISLVTATFGRVEEVQTLLNSLLSQTYKKFELIIIDQNNHDKLKNIIDRFDTLDIKYIKSSIKGLSYNRNLGLKIAKGDIIGFPDDDCFYSSNVLEEVDFFFNSKNECQLYILEAKDPITNKPFIQKYNGKVNRSNTLKYCCSINFFVRNKNILFDENLGVGSYWGSGEESDFLWNYLKKNDFGLFLPNACVYHLYYPIETISKERLYTYALGFGALFKKEIIYRRNFNYIFLFLYSLLRSLGGFIISRQKKSYYLTLKGRICGFINFKIKQ